MSFRALRLSSPLTEFEEQLPQPTEEGYDWSWYETSCPCCRRPLDITLKPRLETLEPIAAPNGRKAYACVMWGTNPGYVLGAAVLGTRLKATKKVFKALKRASKELQEASGGRKRALHVLSAR